MLSSVFRFPYFVFLKKNIVPLFSYDFILVKNFIFNIFKSLILKDKKESCWKTTKKKIELLVGYISATKKMILDVNEFY
jgi:hypothetical protein